MLPQTKVCHSVPHKYCLDCCAVVNITCRLLHLPHRIRLDQLVERVLSLLSCFYHLKYELLWITIALVASNVAAAVYDKLAYVMGDLRLRATLVSRRPTGMKMKGTYISDTDSDDVFFLACATEQRFDYFRTTCRVNSVI